MTRLLGKKPFVRDGRDLLLSRYVDAKRVFSTDQAPRLLDWTAVKLASGALAEPDRDPLANDRLGCCTFSAGGHFQNLIAQHVGRPDLRVTAEMVERDYLRITGGDNGASIRDDLLKTWKRDGLWGTTVLAYALVDWTNDEELALANTLAGGLLGGYLLPLASQAQNDDQGRPQWTVPAGGFPAGQGPGTWGPHAICTSGEDAGNTWGGGVVWERPWRLATCDELWFVLLDIWQVGDRAPNGFAWQDLVRDAEARAEG